MSIEFDLWPTEAVERLGRVAEVLTKSGLPASTVRRVAAELVEIYEGDLSDELRRQIVDALNIPDDPAPASPAPKKAPAKKAPAKRAPAQSATPRTPTPTPRVLRPPVAPEAESRAQVAKRGYDLFLSKLAGLGYVRIVRGGTTFHRSRHPSRRVIVTAEFVRFESSPPRSMTWRVIDTFSLVDQLDAALAQLRTFTTE